MYDGRIGGFVVDQGVVRSIERQGTGDLVVEQLVSLVREFMVDPAEGKFSFGGFYGV